MIELKSDGRIARRRERRILPDPLSGSYKLGIRGKVEMQAEAGLAKQIIQLLQEIIIHGAEVIFERQRRSAQGSGIAYPYSGSILAFNNVKEQETDSPARELKSIEWFIVVLANNVKFSTQRSLKRDSARN